MWIWNLGDKKLGAIGVRTGVGIGQASRAIEIEVGGSFVAESIARIASAVASGIPALNHEFGNHTMEDGAIVERNTMLLGATDRIGPVFGAIGQTDKVGDTERSLVRKQRAGQLASSGVNDGSELWRGHRHS